MEEAIASYRTALAEDPKWAEGWWYLGTLLYDRDEYGQAAEAFQKTFELNPKSGEPLAMLGLSEAKLHRDTQALQHLRAGRELGIPDDSVRHVTLFTLGTLWLARTDTPGSFDYAQEALDSLARDGVNAEDLSMALGRAVLRLRPPDGDTQMVRAAGDAEMFAAQRDKLNEARVRYEKLAAEYRRKPGGGVCVR